MQIEIFEDNLTKADCKDLPSRTAVRGIIKQNGRYLTVHSKTLDITTFPGGGIEAGESLEACVKREVLEETGFLCHPLEQTLTIKEYFHDSQWTNIYFLCDLLAEKTQSLTQKEIDKGLEVVWHSLDDLLDIFENNMTLHDHGSAIHNREFLGLIHSIKGE